MLSMKLVVFTVGLDDLNVQLVTEPMDDDVDVKFLVESEGDLLLVLVDNNDNYLSIHVFKLALRSI